MENFKKIFFVFILFFLAFSAKSYAEIVNKVEVKGNERITLETIIIFGDITIGKNYESSDISLLIKKLYETNFFSNISIELQNGQLNIIVEENPIINTVTFKGEKAEKYKTAITEFLTLREKTSFLENYIKSDINLIKKFEIIKKLRSKNLPTIPTNLEDELNSNIFLRCDQNDLKIKLNMKNQEDFKVFRKVRDLKDSF